MSSPSTQGGGPSSSVPEAGSRQKSQFTLFLFLRNGSRKCVAFLEKYLPGAWPPAPSHLPHYLLAIVAGCAGWQARTPVTVIAPFQMPKAELPFSGEIVADALQDGLTLIHKDIEKERDDPRLRPTEMDLPVLRGLNLPKFLRAQDSTRFAVEVKGVSYERIISATRAMLGTETMISGDVISDGKQFVLVARTANEGPWESIPNPISAEGLKRASRDLAEKILAAQDPTLAGAALLKDGQADQALAEFNRATALKPSDAQVELNLCMGLEANHRYPDAIKCYEHVLKMRPKSPQEVSERLAHAYYLNGDRDEAIKRFDELAHKESYRGALLDLGKALDDTGDHAGALKTYDEFLAKQPRSGKDRNRNLAIAYVNKGVALARQGKHEDASSAYRQALLYAPGDVLILVNLAMETADAGDLDAGVAQLQAVVEENENPDSVAFAHLQFGTLLQKKGDWQAAASEFRKATELRPNYDEAHRSLAYALVHEGFQFYALSEYAQLAKLSPVDADRRYSQVLAYQWLGNALRDQGDYSGAASAYREAIKLKRNYRTAHYELAVILERQRHLDQAIQEYRAALLPNPKELDDSEILHRAQLRLGEALVSQGREHRAEGIAELRRLMELDIKNLECRFCLAKALFEEGDFAEAAAEYQSAIGLNPESAAAHNGLALTLDKQGLIDQAVLEFRYAANLEPGNTMYHANLARELKSQHLSQEAEAEREIVAKLEAIVPRDVDLPLGTYPRCQGVR
jgi:tetratricopeptide (TPR) repeat protein